MNASGSEEVRSGLKPCLARLWRYGLVLSGSRDFAQDLVQATCLRALERADQFMAGTRLDRWLFTILHSIWLNELRARRIRVGGGFVDPDTLVGPGGAEQIEANIFLGEVLREVQGLPEAQRATVFLVYVEGLTYRDAAEVLGVPIGTVMSRLATARLALGKMKQD